MRPPDFSAATRPLAPTQATSATRATVAAHPSSLATLAAAGSGPGGASDAAGAAHFGGLMRQVQSDVSSYLAQGSRTGSAPGAQPAAAASLSLEGQAYLARSQSAADTAASAATAAAAGPGGAAMARLQDEFINTIKPWAQQAGQRLGVAPELVAAHAALESGWGQRPLRQSDGSSSFNLFGLKAGGQWQGAETTALTTEYAGGAALKQHARFRSYPDQASAFHDYAQLLLDNPRYHAALNTGSDAQAFARGLVQGGYATDPNYADKLSRVAARLRSAAALTGKD